MDFYVPAVRMAVQVTQSLSERSRRRELESLAKLAATFDEVETLKVVTSDDAGIEHINGMTIEVAPLHRFLLNS